MINPLKLLFGQPTPPNGDSPPSLATPSDHQPPPDPSGPAVLTPWQTSLRLNVEQESRLVQHADMRLYQIRNECGLDSQNNIIGDNSFMSIRARHEQTYNGDLSWRAMMGSIFGRSNLTLGSGIRHIRNVAARVQDDLLGTEPFFAAMGAKPSREALAKQVEEWLQNRIALTNVRSELRQAQKIALIRNEAVVKTTYVYDSTPYIGPATVYVDQNGDPVRTAKGLYIYKGEQFEPDPSGTTQGLLRMSKDPSVSGFQQPDGSMILMMPQGQVQAWPTYIDSLEQELVASDGTHCETLDYRAFLCPLRYPTIHKADMCVHLYSASPNALRAKYGSLSDVSAGYFDWWDGPGDKKPKYEQGENDMYGMILTPEVLVAEGYLRFDPYGDGRDREILMVWDVKSRKPIYYNYLGVHYKRRPFDVIPGLERIPDRWYGRGIFGLCEDNFMLEDALVNRMNQKDSKEGSITVGRREACVEWQNGVSPTIGGKEIYWLTENWPADKPPIERIRMLEDMEHAQDLLELSQQAQNGMIGAINAKDASTSDMNQSKTATGIVSIQQAADAITKANEAEQIEPINAVLDLVVDLELEHMDAEVLQFTPGEGLLSTINAEEARNMTRDVRLLLTRSKSSQLFQSADQSIGVAVAYRQMMQTDPRGAKILRPLFLAKMKALECDDADDVIPEITDQMIQAWDQQQAVVAQQAQQANQKRASESIQTKYTDLARSEQTQVLQQEGIQPASPEEVQQKQLADTQTQLALKPPQPAPPKQ